MKMRDTTMGVHQLNLKQGLTITNHHSKIETSVMTLAYQNTFGNSRMKTLAMI
jgi:hypothetical protein